MNIKPRVIFMTFASFACVTFLHAASSTKEIFSAADAAKILGQPVVHSQTMGPEKDDDSPAQVIHWSYRGKELTVIVGRLEFASAAEAAKYANVEQIKKMGDGDDEGKITSEPGVGEKAFWAVNSRACMLVFLKGPTIVAIALGGKLDSPESHKADLKAAATEIASRL